MNPCSKRVALFYAPSPKDHAPPNLKSESLRHAMKSSGWGLLYGLTIQTLIYPLEVVKLLQQDPLCNQRCDQIARELFQKSGPQAFYSGISAKLVESGHKQLWRWPLIIELPRLLKRCGYSEREQQALTGLAIASIDAFFSTPFDALKLAAIYRLQRRVSWRGFPTFWLKRSVEWVTFLEAQSYFSNRQQREQKRLHLMQALTVALQTTAAVSVARAPFDVMNTLYQTGQALPLKNLSPLEHLRRMYRGSPLGFSTLLIYNFGTTIFIDSFKQ